MTAKTDFTEAEWTTVLEGPPSAGMVVVSASHGGTFKETFAIGKPKVDRTHYHSMEELRQHELQHVRDAIEVLEPKATQQELSDYRGFVMALAERVAEAHREHGVAVSDDEQAALAEISTSLGQS
jgi:hypothetical protein